ncbi:hypothetical protein [Lichenihabitans psoromatis]|uniref:hypothetical protein n=1 Tax=Lichenihabitans psoromatis TaxID=2528642 RepID=UPI00247AF99C|nr:hypothetical protein [Lichenihabitans psoromatis]
MANGRCRMHGGKSPGALTGNNHALKHGQFTGAAWANRHELAVLLSGMKRLVRLSKAKE